MRDIVERLQDLADNPLPVYQADAFVNIVCMDAVAEIKLLRADLERANSPVWHDPKYGLVND